MDIPSVLLLLHIENNSYSIGEVVCPKIQIKNESAEKIVFDKGFIFDWEVLAFTEPNSITLEDATGKNLLLSYERERSFFKTTELMCIEPGGEEWFYLPISSYYHFYRSDKYKFYVTMTDKKGNLFSSNTIQFEITDIKSNVSPDKIELTLKPLKKVFEHDEPVEVEVSFQSNYNKPLIFLLPQEDSLDGWVNPSYQFTVINEEGRTLPRPLRCGSMAYPVYDEKSKIRIQPGNTYSTIVPLLPYVEMKKKRGNYRLRLIYIVLNNVIGKGGKVLDGTMKWDEHTFIGKLKSKEILISIQ